MGSLMSVKQTRSKLLRAVVATLLAACALPLITEIATAQINWREVRTLKLGRFRTRVEVSSAHTVRLISELDTSLLVSPGFAPDSLRDWQQQLFSELDKPTRTKYIFGNAILVEPYAADSATIGYVLTVADTLGVARTVVTDKATIEEFLDLLSKGVVAAMTLSDAELQRAGPVAAKSIALAKPVNFVYPRTARLAGLSGSALVQFVVDTAGRAKPESITCLEATYKDFADAAAAVVRTMEFRPAELEGHKIEQLVQYPIDFKLNAVLPVKPFEVPVRRGRR